MSEVEVSTGEIQVIVLLQDAKEASLKTIRVTETGIVDAIDREIFAGKTKSFLQPFELNDRLIIYFDFLDERKGERLINKLAEQHGIFMRSHIVIIRRPRDFKRDLTVFKGYFHCVQMDVDGLNDTLDKFAHKFVEESVAAEAIPGSIRQDYDCPALKKAMADGVSDDTDNPITFKFTNSDGTKTEVIKHPTKFKNGRCGFIQLACIIPRD